MWAVTIANGATLYSRSKLWRERARCIDCGSMATPPSFPRYVEVLADAYTYDLEEGDSPPGLRLVVRHLRSREVVGVQHVAIPRDSGGRVVVINAVNRFAQCAGGAEIQTLLDRLTDALLADFSSDTGTPASTRC